MNITEENMTGAFQRITQASQQPGASMNFERLMDFWITPDDDKVEGPVDVVLTITIPGAEPPHGSTIAVRPHTLMKACESVVGNLTQEDRSKISAKMYLVRKAIHDAVVQIFTSSDEEE